MIKEEKKFGYQSEAQLKEQSIQRLENQDYIIANFLSLYDKNIEIEKETLVHLENIKKGLLQQMLI